MNLSAGMRAALERCLAGGLTFACYRRPGTPTTLWAQRTPSLDHVDGTELFELNDVFLVAPFQLDPAHIPFVRSDVELVDGDLEPAAEALDGCEGAADADLKPQSQTTMETYIAGVEAIRAAIGTGTLRKAVLSRVLNVPFDAKRLPELFAHALEAHPDAFVALVRTPEHGTWLGATPERLLVAEDDHVRVDALAGTRASSQAGIPWGGKERDEQEVVTAAVLGSFVALGLKEVHAGAPETIDAGPVQHLRTTVEGELSGVPLGDVALAIHPTPAVCGAPRDAARAVIGQVEAHDRRLYTGFWGPWSADGHTALYVNLRCLQLFHDRASLLVGAGITAGSDAHAEWDETTQKASTWSLPIETLGRGPVTSPPR
jgi:isochorismate synthase